eukprot:symbB.v1.2.036579.t1/scaffold5197.1/size29901/2
MSWCRHEPGRCGSAAICHGCLRVDDALLFQALPIMLSKMQQLPLQLFVLLLRPENQPHRQDARPVGDASKIDLQRFYWISGDGLM